MIHSENAMSEREEQAIAQIKAYYASDQYKEEFWRNMEDTKKFLAELKEQRKLSDDILNQEYTI
jgi:hypothetical protein